MDVDFGSSGCQPERMRSRVNEENLWEFSLLLGGAGGGEVYDGPDVKWTCTHGPILSRIFAARFEAEKVDEQIAAVVAKFISSGSSVSWITGPSTRPVNLGAKLQSCGFVHSVDWVGMDAALDDLPSSPMEPAGCRVVEVRDKASLRSWTDVLAEGFEFSQDARDTAYRQLSAVGLGGKSRLRHFLAYLDGSPSAISTVFYGSQVAGVYYVATVPSARRRGLATAVTHRALVESKGRGCATAVLQATRMGERVYRRMGFHPLCKMGFFYLDLARRHT